MGIQGWKGCDEGKFKLQGVQEVLCFFPQINATHPFYDGEQIMPARDLSVQSLLFASHFLYNQQQPSAGEGEVAKC